MSEPILNWVNEDGEQTARLGQCTFTITQTKRGFRLRGKGKIPPDGGFDIDSHGTEEKVKVHAKTLATAYVGVTDMPLTSDEWVAKYSGCMRVLVNGFPGLKKGTTVGKPREYLGKHSIGVRLGNTNEVYSIFLEHITVVGPNEVES